MKIAVIPARGGSKRLPRKNILPLGNRPMIFYPIKTAMDSGLFENVFVTTDDEEIKQKSSECGALVIDRPTDTATDTAHELSAVWHLVEQLEHRPDQICVLYPTAAFIEPDDLIASAKIIENDPSIEVLMSATRYPIHPFKALEKNKDGFWQPMFPVESKLRSQEYPELFASNGTFYWFDGAKFNEASSYYCQALKVYELPAGRAIDIDTQEDYEQAKEYFKVLNS